MSLVQRLVKEILVQKGTSFLLTILVDVFLGVEGSVKAQN